MIKKKLFTLGAVAGCLLTTGCTNDLTADSLSTDRTEKESIVLAAGDNGTAFITRAGFSGQTRIVAQYVANSRTSANTKTVKTELTASADATQSTESYSSISYAYGQTRYWDDAFIHNTILSVYAIAVPNKENVNLPLAGSDEWSSTASATTVAWSVTATQTAETLASEDLTYSNNIQQSGDNGVYIWDAVNKKYPETVSDATHHTINSATDGRLYYTSPSDDFTSDASTATGGHYDRGQLNFTHALSRIRVNLKAGEGFTDSEIALTGSLDILNEMPVSGKLDVMAGTWSDKSTSTAVKMVNTAEDATEYTNFGKADLTYEAQVLPGYEFANENAGGIQFTIDDKPYHITNDKLRVALGSNYTMEQGKRYIFNITVSKTKIQNITATVVDWVNVTAETIEKENEHIKFEFLSPTGTACEMNNIHFYKYEQDLGQVYTDKSYSSSAGASVTKGKGFGDPATLSDANSDNVFETNWYYKDNKTAYHFRTLNSAAKATLNATTKDKFTMTAGATADYHWGAPMLTSATLRYSPTTGFQNSIKYGIVAASNDTELKITELHMLSNIVVKLQTVSGDAAVNVNNATVTITNLYTKADVDMGIGLITPNTNGNNVMTCGTDSKASEHTFSVIPQDLDRGDSAEPRYVGIKIITADGNEFNVVAELSTIQASAVDNERNQTKDQAIKTWFPGHTYTYTFTLSKKKIEVITATVAKWVDVKAADTELDLEK